MCVCVSVCVRACVCVCMRVGACVSVSHPVAIPLHPTVIPSRYLQQMLAQPTVMGC